MKKIVIEVTDGMYETLAEDEIFLLDIARRSLTDGANYWRRVYLMPDEPAPTRPEDVAPVPVPHPAPRAEGPVTKIVLEIPTRVYASLAKDGVPLLSRVRRAVDQGWVTGATADSDPIPLAEGVPVGHTKPSVGSPVTPSVANHDPKSGPVTDLRTPPGALEP